jgi:MSHA biogenesis protein MshP
MSAPRRRPCEGRTHGFAILSAVFLLIVLALLGAMIVNLSAAQQVGSARDLLGSRAYFAARAGIDWGVYQALRTGSCAAASTLPALAGSAQGFLVQVGCAASGPFDEGGVMVMVYKITSTATVGTPGVLDYANRQLEAVVSTP